MVKGESSKKWLKSQFKDSIFMLFGVGFGRVVLAGVNLIMTMALGEFTNYAVGKSDYTMKQIIMVAIIMFVVEGYVYISESVLKKKIYSATERKIRFKTLENLQKSDYRKLEEYHSSEFAMRLTKDVEQVAGCLPNVITNIFGGLFMAVVSLVYMFMVNWKISLIILLLIPVIGVLTSIFNPLVQSRSRKDKENEDINRIYINSFFETIPIMKVFGGNNILLDKAKLAYNAKYKSAVSLGRVEGVFSFLNNMAGSLMFLVAMGIGAYYTVKGEFSVGNMIATINLLNYIVWPFSGLGGAISEYNQAIVSAERIMEIQGMVDTNDENVVYNFNNSDENEFIDLRNVCYSYVDNVNILSNVNLRINKGEIVTIVGRSGSGKSTLLKMLLGLYKVQNGQMTFQLSQCEEDRIRSYVQSDNYIFTGTVEENICMDDDINEQRMHECAVTVNAEKFIEQMDNGYKTVIGEGSNTLSSGQAQRVAIARALYKDAKVLIFDEPTSNLDAESVNCLLYTLNQLKNDKMIIIATHDINVINNSDRVLNMCDGYITEVEKMDVVNIIEEVY